MFVLSKAYYESTWKWKRKWLTEHYSKIQRDNIVFTKSDAGAGVKYKEGELIYEKTISFYVNNKKWL